MKDINSPFRQKTDYKTTLTAKSPERNSAGLSPPPSPVGAGSVQPEPCLMHLLGQFTAPTWGGTWPQKLSVAQLTLQTGSSTLIFTLNLSCCNLKCFSSYPIPSGYGEQIAACSGECSLSTAKLLGDPEDQDLVNLSVDFILFLNLFSSLFKFQLNWSPGSLPTLLLTQLL